MDANAVDDDDDDDDDDKRWMMEDETGVNEIGRQRSNFT